ATSMRSAVWPSRVCGMACSSSHNDVCAFSDPSASNVVRPTNSSAPCVNTGMTYAPASTSRRHTSTALYAAIPPETPRTIRRPSRIGLPRAPLFGGVFLGVVGAGLRLDRDDLACGDLFERDRQRLAGHRRHLRRDDGPEALAELAEVGVDLPSPFRTQCDEAE